MLVKNRKAFYDYDISDKIEAGIVLQGHEVKSVLNGSISLADSFAREEHGELWLYNVNISLYEYASGLKEYDPYRPRKLLLHASQISRLSERISKEKLTLLPLSFYVKAGRIKVELGLGKGRKKYDKREREKQRAEGKIGVEKI